MALDISQLLQIFLLVISAHTTPLENFNKQTYTYSDDNANYYTLSLELKGNEGTLVYQHFAGETAAEEATLVLKKNKQGKWQYVHFINPEGENQEFYMPILPNSFLGLGEKINFAPCCTNTSPTKVPCFFCPICKVPLSI